MMTIQPCQLLQQNHTSGPITDATTLEVSTDCQLNNTYLKDNLGPPIEDGEIADVPSWYECKQLCDSKVECQCFTWNYWPLVCYLMSSVPDEAHTGTSEGAISGIKSCWEPSRFTDPPTTTVSTTTPYIMTTTEPTTTSTASTTTITDCQAGWSAFKGECYKYFSEEKTWEQAHTDCRTNMVRQI